jgi:hypothetical protein
MKIGIQVFFARYVCLSLDPDFHRDDRIQSRML